jgi:plastocyanin
VRRTVQRIAFPLVAAALVALVPASAGAGAGAGADAAAAAHARAKKPVKKTVGMFDNYYEPAKLTVPVGSTIVWDWPIDTGDSHDVTLKKGPKGVPKFASEIATSEYTYRRKLTKPGTYAILCTLHDEMTMTIVVR